MLLRPGAEHERRSSLPGYCSAYSASGKMEGSGKSTSCAFLLREELSAAEELATASSNSMMAVLVVQAIISARSISGQVDSTSNQMRIYVFL